MNIILKVNGTEQRLAVDVRTTLLDLLREYLIPVNADVRSIEVMMVPEQDHQVNPLGIKGVGEIGIVGMNAAVANAV
jgi:xanthine dehydrogenase YagR molybdenum-binding subunit